ncbi:MAG: hypothetical protein V2A54_09060 [Bacteroidota bacterium]
MAKNFESLKSQLKEVSTMLNAFKSEAVQLRILELIFNQKEFKSALPAGRSEQARAEYKATGGAKRKAGRPKIEKPERKKKLGFKNKVRRTNAGPTVFLNKLESENFFSQPKSLRDIVLHCNNKLNQSFKTTDFTSPMVKLVNEKKLKKSRSADGKTFVFGK